METTNSKIINLRPSAEKADTGLLVSGELYISGCSLFGTEVSLYDNGIISQKFICCLNGFFYFRLDYEKTYTIVVTKSGFNTKTIEFNTALSGSPEKRRHYEFGVTLSPKTENNYETFDYTPAAIIKYAGKSGAFEHDKEYQEQRSKQLIKKTA